MSDVSSETCDQPPSAIDPALREKKRARPPSAKTRAIRGVVGAWLTRGCMFLIAFFMTPFMVRSLGHEQYGIWTLVMSLTGIFVLIDMGLDGATQKYIAQFHTQGNMAAVNRVFVTSMVYYWGLAAVLVIVSIIVAFFFPYVFPAETISRSTLRIVVILSAVTIAIKLAAQSFRAALTALHRFDVNQAGIASQSLLQAAATFVVLSFGGGLVELSAAFLAVVLAGRVTSVIVARRVLPGFSTSLSHFDVETFKLIFRFGAVVAPAAAINKLTDNIGNLVIGVVLGPSSVVYYSVSESLVSKAREIGQGIVGVVAPSASRLEAKGQTQSLFTLMVVSSRILAAFSLATAGLLVIHGRAFLSLWMGASFADNSYGVLCVLAMALVARMASMPLRAILRGTATVRVLLIGAIVELVTIALSVMILVPTLGYVGMAWAVLVGQIASAVLYLPYATCTALGFTCSRYQVQVWPRALFVGAIVLAASGPLAWFFAAKTWLSLACHSLCGATATALGTFFSCLSASQRRDVLTALHFRNRPHAAERATV